MKHAVPPLLINLAIILTICILGLFLRNPLTLVGLMWLQQMPDTMFAPEEPEDEEPSMGFTSELKK